MQSIGWLSCLAFSDKGKKNHIETKVKGSTWHSISRKIEKERKRSGGVRIDAFSKRKRLDIDGGLLS